MMSNELKPCPFCGGEAVITSAKAAPLHWVGCEVCEIESRCFTTREAAILYWNTRPAEDALQAEIERLKDALKQIVEISNRRGTLSVSTLQKDGWFGLAKIAKQELANDADTGKMEGKK